MYWSALPPLNWWCLAWLAPAPWLLLIQAEKLPGRRPYRMLYLAGLVQWLMVLYFLCLPHPAGCLGWLAMSLYCGGYLPAFVGLSRVAVHRLRLPLPLAAGLVWAGFELMRGYFATGISAFLLAHSMVRFPLFIQAADLFGGYGLSLVMMVCTACGVAAWSTRNQRSFWRPLAVAAALLIGVLSYGAWRMQQPIDSGSPVKVALIQGSTDTMFGGDEDYYERSFNEYCELTRQVRGEHADLDLIVWPESMFPPLDVMHPQEKQTPATPSPPPGDRRALINSFAKEAKGVIVASDPQHELHSPDVSFLTGGTTIHPTSKTTFDQYNSALLLDENNLIVDRYFKNHRVLFGEYVPFADWIPGVYDYTPMPRGLTPGQEPRAFQVAGLRFMPLICFESIQPQVVFWQQRRLEEEGAPADVFVNLTNDGWFWGASVLDHHFSCNVFRAVEFRTPVVVAANTGFSGWIDGNGRVLAKGPRRDPQAIYAEVTKDPRTSLYAMWGDLPISGAFLFCIGCAVVGLIRRKSE